MRYCWKKFNIVEMHYKVVLKRQNVVACKLSEVSKEEQTHLFHVTRALNE